MPWIITDLLSLAHIESWQYLRAHGPEDLAPSLEEGSSRFEVMAQIAES